MSEPRETKTGSRERPEAPPEDDREMRELIEARNKLNARIRAKRSGNKKEARKLRERRAMLTGLAVMDGLERDASHAERALIHRWRDKWLTRPEERALFNLPPVGASPALVVANSPSPPLPASEIREAEPAA